MALPKIYPKWHRNPQRTDPPDAVNGVWYMSCRACGECSDPGPKSQKDGFQMWSGVGLSVHSLSLRIDSKMFQGWLEASLPPIPLIWGSFKKPWCTG